MKLRQMLFLAGAAVGFSSGPLFAQPAQAPSTSAEKKAVDPNEMICEKQTVPGSRLQTKRVCMTRAQWADLKSQDRQDVEKVQTMRGMQDH